MGGHSLKKGVHLSDSDIPVTFNIDKTKVDKVSRVTWEYWVKVGLDAFSPLSLSLQWLQWYRMGHGGRCGLGAWAALPSSISFHPILGWQNPPMGQFLRLARYCAIATHLCWPIDHLWTHI